MQLKADPTQILPEELERFQHLQEWEKRRGSAKQAVRTKRAKYAQWPCNRKKKL